MINIILCLLFIPLIASAYTGNSCKSDTFDGYIIILVKKKSLGTCNVYFSFQKDKGDEGFIVGDSANNIYLTRISKEKYFTIKKKLAFPVTISNRKTPQIISESGCTKEIEDSLLSTFYSHDLTALPSITSNSFQNTEMGKGYYMNIHRVCFIGINRVFKSYYQYLKWEFYSVKRAIPKYHNPFLLNGEFPIKIKKIKATNDCTYNVIIPVWILY